MKITKFDASRVSVQKDDKYAGLIFIRKNSGLDLGWENYIVDKGTPKGLTRRSWGQIRIALTDGTYLDGMAMYVDDDYFEDGIDIIAGLLKRKPKLKRYLEKDGEIIFDTVAEPVGEGNPINIVPILARIREREETVKSILFGDGFEKHLEKANRKLAESILFDGGFTTSCKNCAHYNDTLSMTDSPCYNCNRRVRDCWEAKKG